MAFAESLNLLSIFIWIIVHVTKLLKSECWSIKELFHYSPELVDSALELKENEGRIVHYEFVRKIAKRLLWDSQFFLHECHPPLPARGVKKRTPIHRASVSASARIYGCLVEMKNFRWVMHWADNTWEHGTDAGFQRAITVVLYWYTV